MFVEMLPKMNALGLIDRVPSFIKLQGINSFIAILLLFRCQLWLSEAQNRNKRSPPIKGGLRFYGRKKLSAYYCAANLAFASSR